MPSYVVVPRYCGVYYCQQSVNVNIFSNSSPIIWLPQLSLSTQSKVHDTAASTILTQTFVNPSTDSAIAKAKYTFPLYESCAVVSFRCHVGSRLIQGIVKEKEEAKVEYDKAVSRGETAALLEQHTPDVFTTSLGNIPAGETVKVEIEYIMELKHDAQVDGLRFTIPTTIAPRYGQMPTGIQNILGAGSGGMKISVQITMPTHVRSVNSPSHPIAVHLGGHVEDVKDDAFDPKCALACLSKTTTELGNDFILLIKCADLSSPRALLENHPTIQGSKALMITLVPKFTLPPGPMPEIVFVVDRSGSMHDKVEPLKSALRVFLKSLPLGVKFNICSFGSSHSFLWDKSKPYSASTLQEAQLHVNLMDADYGGTEILSPIQSTISKRYKDLNLEIMVLTDGEVWDPEALFRYIQEATTKSNGDIRVFSLGIGRSVSHALVEGIARVGGGFAQIVSDEKEGLESKVVRMLKGGLSAHIKDYRLEWDGKPSEPNVTKKEQEKPIVPEKKKISLFNKGTDADAPVAFSGLPVFVVPAVLMAPYTIPSLFPFSRTTAYVILSENVRPPSSVWLRGTTPSGDELELEIEVSVVSGRQQTIHQLAARKILQELDEGTGYLHSGKYGIDKKKNPGSFDDWVKREGVRVGLKYGLASKWTSFLAVVKNAVKESGDAREEFNKTKDSKSDTKASESETDDFEVVDEVEASAPAFASFGSAPVAASFGSASVGASYKGAPRSRTSALFGSAPVAASFGSAPVAASFGSASVGASYKGAPRSRTSVRKCSSPPLSSPPPPPAPQPTGFAPAAFLDMSSSLAAPTGYSSVSARSMAVSPAAAQPMGYVPPPAQLGFKPVFGSPGRGSAPGLFGGLFSSSPKKQIHSALVSGSGGSFGSMKGEPESVMASVSLLFSFDSFSQHCTFRC
jgi:hypothetical protein